MSLDDTAAVQLSLPAGLPVHSRGQTITWNVSRPKAGSVPMGGNPLLFRRENGSCVSELHLALVSGRGVTDHLVASANKNGSRVSEVHLALVSGRGVTDHLVPGANKNGSR